jgi:hypothetical protein
LPYTGWVQVHLITLDYSGILLEIHEVIGRLQEQEEDPYVEADLGEEEEEEEEEAEEEEEEEEEEGEGEGEEEQQQQQQEEELQEAVGTKESAGEITRGSFSYRSGGPLG